MGVLSDLFSWPAGIVVGNLIASAMWAIPAILHLDRLARRHHKAHMNLLVSQHREHMAALRKLQGGARVAR
jgi:hypothetical protein